MRKIKKYANGRLYDTVVKDYITSDRIAELLKTGEEIVVVETKTGNDITAAFITRLEGDDAQAPTSEGNDFLGLFHKGREAVFEQLRNSATFLRSSLAMAEEEVDRLINLLIKDKKLSLIDGSVLKEEIRGFSTSLRKLINANIDQRVSQALDAMNLATRDQIVELTTKMDKLTQKIQKMEKKASKK